MYFGEEARVEHEPGAEIDAGTKGGAIGVETKLKNAEALETIALLTLGLGHRLTLQQSNFEGAYEFVCVV